MASINCGSCKHSDIPSGSEPCCSCIAQSKWEAARRAPEDITSENQLKDGPLVETARAVMKQITRLDYAIAGVRSKISSIGLKFTDKDLSRDEIAFLVGQLNALQVDLFELEEERERKLRGAADVENRHS